jgi:hypothetical protein
VSHGPDSDVHLLLLRALTICFSLAALLVLVLNNRNGTGATDSLFTSAAGYPVAGCQQVISPVGSNETWYHCDDGFGGAIDAQGNAYVRVPSDLARGDAPFSPDDVVARLEGFLGKYGKTYRSVECNPSVVLDQEEDVTHCTVTGEDDTIRILAKLHKGHVTFGPHRGQG